jgi:RNA polymerase sigma-70 factor (ECF subfamily)
MGPAEGMHGGQGQKGTREGVVVGRARRRLRVVFRKLEGAVPIRKKRIEVTSIDRGITTSDGERMHIDAKSQTLNPEETIIQGQRLVHMRLLVSKLKPKYRELVEKRYFEEKSYEEIAEELNLPLGTVKAQLFRARDFLAAMMQQTKDSI